MAENSKIEWCDHTVNLWWGCSKVHTGCKNCYAEHLSDTRYKNNLWGEHASRKRIKSAFHDLDKYQRLAEAQNIKLKIFVGSMMDIFEDTKVLNNPIDGYHTHTGDVRWSFLSNIEENKYPNLIFLLLTKRPENIRRYIPMNWAVEPPANVWFGTSASNAKTLMTYGSALNMHTPPKSKRFLSIEPQVGSVKGVIFEGIDWVIQGGESGPKKRFFDIQWAYELKEICKVQKVPYFFKQIDKIKPIPGDLMIREFPKF